VASEPYFEYQVEQPVTPAASSPSVRYPEMLRTAGVGGEVLVQFVVDREGRADPKSLKILKSDHDLFTAAVRNALPQLQFNPARVGGKAVSQVVQQPFTFSVNR
jgi:protein TonB